MKKITEEWMAGEAIKCWSELRQRLYVGRNIIARQGMGECGATRPPCTLPCPAGRTFLTGAQIESLTVETWDVSPPISLAMAMTWSMATSHIVKPPKLWYSMLFSMFMASFLDKQAKKSQVRLQGSATVSWLIGMIAD